MTADVINAGGGGSSVAAFALGTAAARPAAAAGNAKTAYYATDTGELTVSDGSAWNVLQQTSTASFLLSNNGDQKVGGSFGGAGIIFKNFGEVDITPTSGQSLLLTAGSFDVKAVGQGLKVAEGANAKQGTFTMNGTTNVVVANTSVTANSRILFSLNAISGTPGIPGIVSRVAGTSFTVVSTAATDLGTYAYEIFEPG